MKSEGSFRICYQINNRELKDNFRNCLNIFVGVEKSIYYAVVFVGKKCRETN